MKIRNRATKAPRIEMLPLIDIVFLLLVFFIYAMLSMAVHRGLQLDLPESSQAATSEKNNSISLSIQRDTTGIQIFLDKKAVHLSQLAQYLAPQNSNNSKSPTVLVFAEEQINYQQLYRVLDELNKCGVSDISLQASPE